MEFHILGPVELWHGDRPLSLGRAKERSLLGVLMLNYGKVVGVRTVIEALWDEDPPARAKKDLQAYVSRLRASLRQAGASATIVTRRAGYLFQPGQDDIDYARFKVLLREGADARRDARFDDAASILYEAMALWQGPVIAELATYWMEQRRDDLENYEQVAGYQALCDVELERGNYREVLQILENATIGHEFDSKYIAQRLAALDGLGHYAEFDSYWQQTYRKTVDSFGTGPTRELQDLHRRLLQSRDSLVPVDRRRPQAALRALPPAQLPSTISQFIGRDDDLARLDDVLMRSRASGPSEMLIILISGQAGIGKTELGLRWAHAIRSQFPHGQLYVDLRGFAAHSPAAPADVLLGFLDALGVPRAVIPTDVAGRSAMLRTVLDGRRVLLFLDNARNSDQVRPLLPGSVECVVAVTSRNRLTDLVAWHGAQRLTAEPLTDGESGSLLESLLTRAGALVAVPEPATVGRLSGGSPRVIRTLAEWIAAASGYSLEGYSAPVLPTTTELLLSGESEAGTILSSNLWSYDVLTAEQARTFRWLSLHAEPDISVLAVIALDGTEADNTRQNLAGLVALHLVFQHRDRYRMDTLTQVVGRRLAAKYDGDDTRQLVEARLLDWYLRLSGRIAQVLAPTMAPLAEDTSPPSLGEIQSYTEAVAVLETECASIAAALRHGCQAHLPLVLKILRTLRPHLTIGDCVNEWLNTHNAVLVATRHMEDLDGEGETLTALARIHGELGNLGKSLECIYLAITIFRRTQNRHGEAEALLLLAAHNHRQGDTATARRHLDEVLALHRHLDEPAQRAAALYAVGALSRSSRPEEAQNALEHALTIYRDVRDYRQQATSLTELGLLALDNGHTATAIEALRQAQQLHEEHSAEHDRTLLVLSTLSELLCDVGEHTEVLVLARKAIGMCHSPDDHVYAVRSLVALVRSLIATGRNDEARAEARQTVALIAEINDPINDHVQEQFELLGLWQDC